MKIVALKSYSVEATFKNSGLLTPVKQKKGSQNSFYFLKNENGFEKPSVQVSRIKTSVKTSNQKSHQRQEGSNKKQ
jgi:hypothetical protein